jgi:dipeptidyl aminopeptidase/acylaminoacyl peptidase
MAMHPARRWRRRRTAVVLAILIVLAAAVVFLGAGYLAYQDLSVVTPRCGTAAWATQTPADFEIAASDVQAPPDPGPYRFTDFRDVEFPTRGGGLTIRAWYAPPRAAGPVVVVVHGYNACRRDWSVLLPAGMLHRAGFGVLLPDLRNHGDSDVDGGRWAGGAKEYRDVLGAWDWLVTSGVMPRRIGIFGVSLGAATVTIATGEEPRIAATWADSSYARFAVAASEYAESKGYPGWVATSAGRPFFIVQGLEDTTVRPHNGVDLASAATRGGTSVEPWFVPGATHVREMLLQTDRYERTLDGFFSTAIGTP